MDDSERIHNFDFLRGGFVILALMEHFGYYLNVWYSTYFREQDHSNQVYSVHWDYVGTFLPIDNVSYLLALVFIPWVSQIYLTLATFNLAKRKREAFCDVYGAKLALFGTLFLFFFFENFLVAPNFGQAISIYPLMTWMVILSLLTLIYRWIGFSGVVVLFFLSFIRFVVPWDLSGNFEEWMTRHVHDSFEYDARIQYFLSSGCLGFILGYTYRHLPISKDKYFLSFFSAGLLGLSVWIFFGENFFVRRLDVLATEHMLIKNFPGTLGILGVQLMVLSFFLLLEGKDFRLKNIPIISWVGHNSILVFAFHQIFFVKIWLPIVLFILGLFNVGLMNTWYHVILAVVACLAFSWGIKKTAVFRYVTKT